MASIAATAAAPAAAAVRNKLYTLVILAERAAHGVTPPALSPAPAVTGSSVVSARTPYSRVLLGLKKRGFGAGKWNGFGGKIEIGETPRAAAIREMREEAGITLEEAALSKRGVLLQEFERTEAPQVADAAISSALGTHPMMEIHLYLAERYSGSLAESDEMRPQWWALPDVPYAHMWADDQHWLPVLLSQDAPCFRAHFLFRGEATLLSHKIDLMDPQQIEDMRQQDHEPRTT